jgi:hypothetical protein
VRPPFGVAAVAAAQTAAAATAAADIPWLLRVQQQSPVGAKVFVLYKLPVLITLDDFCNSKKALWGRQPLKKKLRGIPL